MLANVTRAWSSSGVVFWKRSFQTSTGGALWLSSEHVSSVAKLLDVRCLALHRITQEIKQRLSEHVEICLRTLMQQNPNLSLRYTAYISQSYRGTGMLSDGKIAQSFRGTVNVQGLFEL